MQKKFNTWGGGNVAIPDPSEVITPANGITITGLWFREYGPLKSIVIDFERDVATPANSYINIGELTKRYRPAIDAFVGGTNHVGSFSRYVDVRNIKDVAANTTSKIRAIYLK